MIDPGQGTCSASRSGGRCIDFVVVSNSLLSIILDLELSWQVPFSPHAALTLWISRSPKRLWELQAVRPTSFPANFATLVSERSQTEHAAIWRAITEEQVKEVLSLVGAGFEGSQENKSQHLSIWAARYELWAHTIIGTDLSDLSLVARHFGRAQRVRYKWSPVAPKRRALVSDWKVPGGLNAQARCAATIAAISRRLAQQPKVARWRQEVLHFFGARGPMAEAFWRSFEDGKKTDFIIAGYKAVRAAKDDGPRWRIESSRITQRR